MIGKVADIILMSEACAEGRCIVRLSFLSSSCDGTPCKVIPRESEEHVIPSINATAGKLSTLIPSSVQCLDFGDTQEYVILLLMRS